jgi:hypothetical protein
MVQRFHKRSILFVAIAVGVMMITALDARGQEAKPGEYEVKAAYLYHFAKFVDWPADAFKDDQSPICLSILGDDPFGSILNSIRDKTVRGRTLIIKRCRSIEQIHGCHILFISPSEKGNLKQILNVLKSSSILTVSETERFTQQGGMINFITVDNRIQFEINPAAAQRNRLKISSQLLKLARIVATESPKERE